MNPYTTKKCRSMQIVRMERKKRFPCWNRKRPRPYDDYSKGERLVFM